MTPRSPKDIRSRLDFWQALTGACLALFVTVHLLLEGSVVLSPDLTNSIAWFLEASYIAQIAAPCIVLLILVHFYIAARKMPVRAGELQIFVAHSKALKETDTWLWLVQVFTAIIILAGAFFHVYTVMTDLPITANGTAARLHNGWIFFHLVFLPSVIAHTGIGVWRLAVKYGICLKKDRDVWRRRIWITMACYMLLGLCALTRLWFQG
ncbi:MAG: succinate dehydrogenase/fumarate reductase transmembrane subunit [Desulfovibrionaceae bacterium]|nr:succinate dehydrogenase/fumarate reductase transmembrane subunit [Desulfovibrionaceae bacterium]